MSTDLQLSGAIKRTQVGNTDAYYGGTGAAYANLAAAYAGIPSAVRFGKVFGVQTAGVIAEYIWRDSASLADGDEVPYQSSGTGFPQIEITAAALFSLIGSSGLTFPAIYHITDGVGGTIFVRSTSTSTLADTAEQVGVGWGYYNPSTGDFILSYVISVTKSAIDALITANKLFKGITYNITDADVNLYGGSSIFLKAISVNKLEQTGTGLFYNPIYDAGDAHNGIYNKFMYPDMGLVTGRFEENEPVTADNSATGIYLAYGFLEYVSGDWSAATSITGDSSGATVSVTDQVTPTTSIGRKAIWGGKVWNNLTGDLGYADDVFNLDSTNWEAITYTDANYYTPVVDSIDYDFENDAIIFRDCKEGHNIRTSIDNIAFWEGSDLGNPIKYFQWGQIYKRDSHICTSIGGLINSINCCGYISATLGTESSINGGVFAKGSYVLITMGNASTFKCFLGIECFFKGSASNFNTINIKLGSGSAVQTSLSATLNTEASLYLDSGCASSSNRFSLGIGASLNVYLLDDGAPDTGRFEDCVFKDYANVAFENPLTKAIANTTFDGEVAAADISSATYIYDDYAKVVLNRVDDAPIVTFWNNLLVQEAYLLTS